MPASTATAEFRKAIDGAILVYDANTGRLIGQLCRELDTGRLLCLMAGRYVTCDPMCVTMERLP